MAFKTQRDFNPLKLPLAIIDTIQEYLLGFLVLLVVMGLTGIAAYCIQYQMREEQIVNFAADEKLLQRIDDFRIEKGLETRSEAIRQLIEKPLTEMEKESSEKVSDEIH